ncbi:MAG: aminoglycoside phosphotransferase family protein [Rhodospirillales bacterium]
MFEPRAAARPFLDAHGWAGIAPAPLAGDASFRRYFRLADGKRRAVLMDAPPLHEDVRPFVAVGEHLAALGFSAPRIEAKNPHDGFLLLEDLGDATFTRVLREGANEAELYALAADTLVALHKHPAQTNVDVPPYDAATLDREAALLVDWFLPAWTGAAASPALRRDYLELWRKLYALADIGTPCLVLRDYHVDNLVLLADRPGIAACGLLDFQDARLGSCVYDLASLVEDARRDVSPDVRAACVARYLAAFPQIDKAAFDAGLAVLGAQRSAKIIGIFVRLALRDGKPHYLGHIARVWRLLEASLTHPALADLEHWFAANVPNEWRTAPKIETAA